MNDGDSSLRRYTPLGGVLPALLLALFVLPSALNIPQSNPTQTLEFAPIPPEDDDPPPPEAANLESLSLGTSSTSPGEARGGGGAGPMVPPPMIPDGFGERPVTKRCVGDPPRQSEDPLAPPCVAHFEGDNGGATYPGVTADEVRIVIARDAFFCTPSENGCDDETVFKGQYFDLALAPEANPSGSQPEPGNVRTARRFQTFFNQRYQTYGRFLHFYVYFMSGDKTPEDRRADAAQIMQEIDPFATVMVFSDGLEGEYTAGIAQQDRLVFGSSAGQREDEYYRQFPGLVWSRVATVERSAELFASFVCQRVVAQPVVDTGVEGDAGQPRRLGMLRSGDPQFPNLTLLAQTVRRITDDCGAVYAVDRVSPITMRHSSDPQVQATSTENMAQFQSNDVTTIINPGGMESTHSSAGASLNYRPEWVLFGEGATEGYQSGQRQDQDAWSHAWMVTQRPLDPPSQERPCEVAVKEADPSVGTLGISQACNRGWYEDIHQLVTGIQVAGPRLAPESLERGFRAIPAIASDDPTVPACYYVPGDYTCIKDGTIGFWDSDGQASGATSPGCWRMVDGARRHLPYGWPEGNIDANAAVDDPCNGFAGPLQLHTAGM